MGEFIVRPGAVDRTNSRKIVRNRVDRQDSIDIAAEAQRLDLHCATYGDDSLTGCEIRCEGPRGPIPSVCPYVRAHVLRRGCVGDSACSCLAYPRGLGRWSSPFRVGPVSAWW